VSLWTFNGSLHPNYPDFLNLIYLRIVEVSAKSRKDNTGTLSLVINKVRLKEDLPKSALAFKGGVGGTLLKPSIFRVL